MALKLCTGCHKEVNVDPKQTHCGFCGAYLRLKRGPK
jgi:rRNA maturation endonuclease Nob1